MDNERSEKFSTVQNREFILGNKGNVFPLGIFKGRGIKNKSQIYSLISTCSGSLRSYVGGLWCSRSKSGTTGLRGIGCGSRAAVAELQMLVLIWGASSSFGAYATYLAAAAGYTVVGVASSKNAQLVKSFGAVHFVDRKSPTVTQELIDIGPFEAVLAAADAAQDQPVLGAVLAAHGEGSFLSTMGLRPGVELPPGVQGNFVAIMYVYLDPKTRDFTTWV
ncbi:hypothetical protein BOTNAR_0168g00280 [Botryotinia narcissicola]|uniref:Alcohol dehydrogenase-like C-terminal domain-containing protein n=1 Tax=Botryotinia narcissicola TaxID=278944 RepID=A0A4Z1IQW7_9HELO|nr:hypothetical protein BOTNAR_0168g00280 [Botryotinia narcissicola]